MSQPLFHLEQIADSIGNLTSNDLDRLARLIVRNTPNEAADLLDGIQGDFNRLELALGLL